MLDRIEQQFDRLRKKSGKAINRYGLITAGDRIAVALSGGKDSLALLEILSLRRKYLPIDYELYAIHVEPEGIPYRADLSFLSQFCESMKVPFFVRKTLVRVEENGLSPCFICSWARRKEIFTQAKELQCNRIALGHSMDDSVETLFMNMVFHARMTGLSPRLSMFDGEFDLIRPLILVTEKELSAYARIKEFPGPIQICPWGERSKRAQVREILKGMDRLYKRGKKNIFRAMDRIREEDLTGF